MLHESDNTLLDKIVYGFCAIPIFTVMFPLLFLFEWLFLILDDEDPITWECFAKLFSPKFWYNISKDTIHDNFK